MSKERISSDLNIVIVNPALPGFIERSSEWNKKRSASCLNKRIA
jgi:hypothetical protein